MTKITFVTGNKNKADLMSKYLGVEIEHIKLDLTEIQSLDVEDVVTHKVKEAYSQLKKPVVVEDTFVVYHALGKLPGPFIKFFLHELGTEGICKLVNNYPDKSATASVNFGYYDGKEVKIFSGVMKGIIAPKPKGDRGFGWDPTFIPDGYDKTRGEMTEDEYTLTSPRRQAVEKLGRYLKELEDAN